MALVRSEAHTALHPRRFLSVPTAHLRPSHKTLRSRVTTAVHPQTLFAVPTEHSCQLLDSRATTLTEMREHVTGLARLGLAVSTWICILKVEESLLSIGWLLYGLALPQASEQHS